MKNRFSLFLIAGLVLSILTALPGVSATPARPYTGASGLFDFIETCIGNSCDLIESCRSESYQKTSEVEGENNICVKKCSDEQDVCFAKQRTDYNVKCDFSQCYSGCYPYRQDWNNHWGGTDYIADTNGWADDYFRAFTSECEAAKPREAAETEAQAEDEERNQLQAEVELLLDEIAGICLGIEGCKPGDRESPSYFNDIIDTISKLHSDSCDKGNCIKVPIDKLTNLADRIIDWNQREAAWESNFKGLTPEPIETQVRTLNQDSLTNLYSSLIDNLKEEAAKPAQAQTDPSTDAHQIEATQEAAGVSLSERFGRLEKNAPSLPRQAVDDEGNIISPQIYEGGLDELMPSAKMEFALYDLKKGEAASAVFPQGLNLGKIILTASQPISGGTTTVTIIDG